MRIPRLALAVAAAAAIGWSGIVVVASAAPPKCADLDAVPADIAPVPAVISTPTTATTSSSAAATTPSTSASARTTTSSGANSTSAGPTLATSGPGQTCQIQRTDPAYSLDIVFPLDFPDQKSVTDYVKQTRDGFLNVAKSGAPRDMPTSSTRP